MARSLRKLVEQTDEIQRFEIADRPRIHSVIAEIEELGRSVFTMRSVVRRFSSFIPRQIVRQLIEIRRLARASAARGARSRCYSPMSPISPPRRSGPTRPR